MNGHEKLPLGSENLEALEVVKSWILTGKEDPDLIRKIDEVLSRDVIMELGNLTESAEDPQGASSRFFKLARYLQGFEFEDV